MTLSLKQDISQIIHFHEIKKAPSGIEPFGAVAIETNRGVCLGGPERMLLISELSYRPRKLTYSISAFPDLFDGRSWRVISGSDDRISHNRIFCTCFPSHHMMVWILFQNSI
jgi:hypothetical protein